MASYYYTGIGSRSTPLDMQHTMTEVAMHMAQQGWMLRTGATSAADKAFEVGSGGLNEIYVPWSGWQDRPGISSLTTESDKLARDVWEFRKGNNLISMEETERWGSVEWDDLHPGTKGLFAKCMCMLLGKNLDSPSDALICWTPMCNVVGISAHSISLALMRNIPVINLGDMDTYKLVMAMLSDDLSPLHLLENRGKVAREHGVDTII